MKSLLRTPQAQAILASLLSFYLTFALRTTRWTLDGQEHFRLHGAGAPAVFAFWHEFLPLMPALSLIARKLPFYRPTPIHTLVSQHRDGQFIGAVLWHLADFGLFHTWWRDRHAEFAGRA